MELYLEAEALGIDVAQVREQKLRAEIQAIKAAQWSAQHADFLVAYNSNVEAEGVALQEWWVF
jgi:post-segregation antitoxin (ccd killing protein)